MIHTSGEREWARPYAGVLVLDWSVSPEETRACYRKKAVFIGRRRARVAGTAALPELFEADKGRRDLSWNPAGESPA